MYLEIKQTKPRGTRNKNSLETLRTLYRHEKDTRDFNCSSFHEKKSALRQFLPEGYLSMKKKNINKKAG